MKDRSLPNLITIAVLITATTAACAQSVRELLNSEPSLKIYGVIFGVTASTNSTPPVVRVAMVVDPTSGKTNAVKVDVPGTYITAARKKIEAKKHQPKLKDGKPVEFFTYFLYVPGHSNVVIVDLDKPLDQQP